MPIYSNNSSYHIIVVAAVVFILYLYVIRKHSIKYTL